MNQKLKKDIITRADGGGGLYTDLLIKEIFLSKLSNPILDRLDDAAVIPYNNSRLAFTTDSFVVYPVFFPGGDIGKLAMCGTLNDLAMQGAIPLGISLALIIEEGFKITDLEKIIDSIASITKELNVPVVTGDTKVLERITSERSGKQPLICINTSGVGYIPDGIDVHISNARDGDKIIITGSIGDHGIAIMCARENLMIETPVISDVTPLTPLIHKLLEKFPEIHCLRDPTRGGLASALNDIAESSRTEIHIFENALPVKSAVRGVCSLLGLDILECPNEGRAIIVAPEKSVEKIMIFLRENAISKDSSIIGEVRHSSEAKVILHTFAGGERIIIKPSGENLPRIC